MSELDSMVIKDYLKKLEKHGEVSNYLLLQILHEVRRIEHRLNVPIKEKKEPLAPDTTLPDKTCTH
jgi:hypothetical protein